MKTRASSENSAGGLHRARTAFMLAVLLAPLALLALSASARASTGFAALRSFDSGGAGLEAVVVADFNGDGKPDLAVLNSGVSVMLGNGNNTFQPPVIYSAGGLPIGVAVGDVNNDGHPDLVVANGGSNSVSVLLNNGDGTFGSATNFSTGVRPVAVVIADFNQDGNADVAVVSAAENGIVSVLLGNGNGTFQAGVFYGVGSDSRSVVVGDFNGDGFPDLATVNESSSNVSILLNNDNGTFKASVDYATGSAPTALATGDFNGDGALDLAVTYASGVDILLGNGNGTFQSPNAYGSSAGLTTIAVADFNNDGNQDLVVTGTTEAEIFLGNGAGSFQSPVVYSGVAYTPTCVAVGEFTNDGNTDIVVGDAVQSGGGPTDGTINELVGEGNGAFQTAMSSAVGYTLPPFISAGAGDFNRDGALDLATLQYDGNAVTVQLGNGNGTFKLGVNYSIGAASEPRVVVVGDFNGDGNPDLATANYGGNVSVLLGNGDGTFQAAIVHSAGKDPSWLVAADFNGDGRLDLAVADNGGSDVAVLLGNGNGTFQTPRTYATDGQPYSVATADFNGDGYLDLVTGNGVGTVSVLLGNGDGTFQQASNYNVGSPSGLIVVAGDYNGDGKPDLAVGSQCNTTCATGLVSILLGNGDGTFEMPVNYSVGPYVYGLATADLNADGYLDLVTANDNPGADDASVLLGNGDGTFQNVVNYGSSLSDAAPQAVAIGDFNGDGALDFVLPDLDGTNNDVTVFLNTLGTSITLSSSQNPSTFGQPVTFTAIVKASIAGSGTPTGSVTFFDGGTSLGTVGLTSGTASLTTSTLSVGSHSITAMYSGDANFAPHTSSALLQVVNSPGPIVVLSPTSLTFGGQVVGTTSTPQNVTLTNTGTATLIITSIATTGDFAQTNNCGSSVAPGASCTIMVTFTPTQTGTRTGALTVTDNAPGSPQSVSLTGTGLALNPLPEINPPLVPTVAAPGGSGFTLTVHGAAFVSGAVVNWNGSPRTTTFVSDTEVTAAILASDIATAGTASVTVSNPTPGGGVSNVALFDVTLPTTYVTLGRTDLALSASPASVITADLNGDGKPDMVLTDGKANNISVLLGNGNGTFGAPVTYATGSGAYGVSVGDFNGDGKPDLAVANHGSNTVSILLGNGDGTFQTQKQYTTGTGAQSVAVGDFNQDGKLDLAVENGSSTVSILLGNGDGTFQAAVNYATGSGPSWVVASDFNGDGTLDLATANYTAGTASILLGNGDGTFKPHVDYAVGSEPLFIATADFNGDAKPDLAVTNGGSSNVSILLGNGDGTFQAASNYATGTQPFGVAAGDLNGDGKLDLAVANETSNTVSVLFGNGDGTFQTHVDFATGAGTVGVALADFNADGRLDAATADKTANSVSVLLQVNGASVMPASLNFGNQNVGTTSSAQDVTLTNTGSAALTITSISITGEPTDFSQTNTCPASLAGGQSCTIAVTFSPTSTGTRSASLNVSDNGPGSPQIVALTGVGVGAPAVMLSPTSLTFGSELIGSTSAAQNVTLTNTGSAVLTISAITTTANFAATNTCGPSVPPAGSCTISVTFTPIATGTITGTLSVTDNAAGSPQTVSLTGTGISGLADSPTGTVDFFGDGKGDVGV